jgi:hypothetical protein
VRWSNWIYHYIKVLINDEKGTIIPPILCLVLAAFGLYSVLSYGIGAVDAKNEMNRMLSKLQQDCQDEDNAIRQLQDGRAPASDIRYHQYLRDQKQQMYDLVSKNLDILWKAAMDRKVSKASLLWVRIPKWIYSTVHYGFRSTPEKNAAIEEAARQLNKLLDQPPEPSGDELDKAMAAVETDHILNTIENEKGVLKPVIEYLRNGGDLSDHDAINEFLQNNSDFQDTSLSDFDDNAVLLKNVMKRFFDEYKKQGLPENIVELVGEVLREKYGMENPVKGEASVDTTKYKSCDVRISYKPPDAKGDGFVVDFHTTTGSFSGNKFGGKGDYKDWVGSGNFHSTGTIDAVIASSSKLAKDSKVTSLTAIWNRKFESGELEEYTLVLKDIPYSGSDPGIIYYWLGLGPGPNYYTIPEPRLKNVLVGLTIKDTPAQGSKKKPTTTNKYVLTQCRVTIGH